MIISKVIKTVEAFFEEELKKPGEVKSANYDQDFWKVQVEVPEDVEYMRKRGRDDLVAIYEVTLDNNIEVISFSRKHLRARDSIDLPEICS